MPGKDEDLLALPVFRGSSKMTQNRFSSPVASSGAHSVNGVCFVPKCIIECYPGRFALLDVRIEESDLFRRD